MSASIRTTGYSGDGQRHDLWSAVSLRPRRVDRQAPTVPVVADARDVGVVGSVDGQDLASAELPRHLLHHLAGSAVRGRVNVRPGSLHVALNRSLRVVLGRVPYLVFGHDASSIRATERRTM